MEFNEYYFHTGFYTPEALRAFEFILESIKDLTRLVEDYFQINDFSYDFTRFKGYCCRDVFGEVLIRTCSSYKEQQLGFIKRALQKFNIMTQNGAALKKAAIILDNPEIFGYAKIITKEAFIYPDIRHSNAYIKLMGHPSNNQFEISALDSLFDEVEKVNRELSDLKRKKAKLIVDIMAIQETGLGN